MVPGPKGRNGRHFCALPAPGRVASLARRRMIPIYADHNATTLPDPEVRAVVDSAAARLWGNPSSVHRIGREARAALDEARYRLATLWACKPSEVVFTGGGTEANNLALLGTTRLLRSRGRHLLVSPVEHHAVLHTVQYLARHEGFELTLLPVDALGRVDPADVAARIRPDTVLVSVMAANNEVGTVQPVAEIGRLCRERGVVFHTDAVQAFGKLPFRSMADFEADLVTVCAHKFHGPKGAGALYVRSPLLPHPVQHGGAQENERRGGTENLPAILGLVEAFARGVMPPVFPEGILRTRTEALALSIAGLPGVTLRGHPTERLPNTVAFTVQGTDSIALLANLDLEGVCASSGSACTAGSVEPSHVLQAMGVPPDESNALVRLSFGRDNTEEEFHRIAELLPKVIRRSRGQ